MRGKCSVCGRFVGINAAGRLYPHGIVRCSGSLSEATPSEVPPPSKPKSERSEPKYRGPQLSEETINKLRARIGFRPEWSEADV